MSRSKSPALLDRYTSEVEQMIVDHTPFDDVMDAVEEADLMPDEKAALWMLAWSLIGPDKQEQTARRMVELVANNGESVITGNGGSA